MKFQGRMNSSLRTIAAMLLVSATALAVAPGEAGAASIVTVGDIFSANGISPHGALTAYNGALYGTTLTGGANGDGTIYSFNPSTSAITDLINFSGSNGNSAQSGMTLVNGVFYGTTNTGGVNNVGEVYAFNPSTSTIANIGNFSYSNGWFPIGGLGSNGGTTLYGTTSKSQSGGGELFSTSTVTNTTTVVASLGTGTASYLSSRPVFIGGVLYGTGDNGGAYGDGAIFSYNTSTNTAKTIFSFNGSNGAYPFGGMTNVGGVLYGVTQGGVVYSYDTNTSAFSLLATMPSNLGNSINATPLYENGVLYIVASGGGSSNDGAVIAYNLATNTFTNIADFNGGNPQAGLVDYNGTLYGTTSAGISGVLNSSGTVYTISGLQIQTQSVPEPSGLAVMLLGLLALGAITLRRKSA